MGGKFILNIIFLIVASRSVAQQINLHPVPREIMYSKHNDDFTVCVRIPGGDWQDLFEYKVGDITYKEFKMQKELW